MATSTTISEGEKALNRERQGVRGCDCVVGWLRVAAHQPQSTMAAHLNKHNSKQNVKAHREMGSRLVAVTDTLSDYLYHRHFSQLGQFSIFFFHNLSFN